MSQTPVLQPNERRILLGRQGVVEATLRRALLVGEARRLGVALAEEGAP